jgi:hypothetical protein
MIRVSKYFYKKYRQYRAKKTEGLLPNFILVNAKPVASTNKKTAIILMVKNESQIIEYFVRINSYWADHIFIINDRSSDSTTMILESLIAEGFKISIIENQSLEYHQDKVMTGLMRSVAMLDYYDFIVPLDADEFVFDFDGYLKQVNAINANIVIRMKWKTLIPKIAEPMEDPYPFKKFDVIINEPIEIKKLVIPNKLAKKSFLSMGNHEIYFKKLQTCEYIDAQFLLFHAPVRSAAQLVSKIIIGSSKFKLKRNKARGEGKHWLDIYLKIKVKNFVISLDDLRLLAYCYTSSYIIYDKNNIDDFSCVPPPFSIKYSYKSENTVIQQLAGFIEELAERKC